MAKNRTFPFSIRVYGLFVHDEKLLITEEKWFDTRMIKLPGGGLEYGESPEECLRREFMEECNINLSKIELLYIPKKFIPAIFYKNTQVIPLYYKVESNEIAKIKISKNWHTEEEMGNNEIFFHWIAIKDIQAEIFTFPGDRELYKHLLNNKLL